MSKPTNTIYSKDFAILKIKTLEKENKKLKNIIKEVRECLNKNRVYIFGERNLAFEIEKILDKGE